MKKNNVVEFAGRDAISDPLTDLLRAGAQQLITQAVEAEHPLGLDPNGADEILTCVSARCTNTHDSDV